MSQQNIENSASVKYQDQSKYNPPPYSTDILAPPTWQGAPGQLMNWSATSSAATNKYGIFGTDSQVLQVMLMPGESVNSEPGAMLYKADNVKMSTSAGGCCNGMKRTLGGESFFRNKYTNKNQMPACVTLAPSFPAKIIPIDLSRSGEVMVNPGLYLAHIGDVHVTFHFVKNLMAGCFGGSGFLLLKIKGTGTVFLNGGGTIMEKILAPGEVLLMDTDALVGFAGSANYSVQTTGGCITCCCGGEGLFNTKITGPGLVMVQSMPLRRLQESIAPHAAAQGAAAGAAAGASAAQ